MRAAVPHFPQLTDLGICGKLSCIFTSKEAGTPQASGVLTLTGPQRSSPRAFAGYLSCVLQLLARRCWPGPVISALVAEA